MTQSLIKGDDGLDRCWWGSEPPVYREYHDDEWGRPVADDNRLFEKICLEGFQAGLSWLTILRKRENFRSAFANFDPLEVVRFREADVESLLQDQGIVRHEGKIRSVINNAGRALELMATHGSLSSYFWGWADPDQSPRPEIPATTERSTQLSKELKRMGWSFIGPTTVYAFMQAMGLVNDHLQGCHVREACSRERLDLLDQAL